MLGVALALVSAGCATPPYREAQRVEAVVADEGRYWVFGSEGFIAEGRGRPGA